MKVSVGQHSDKGRKPANQDFHGIRVPDEPLLTLKGIAVALADGISSSDVSQVASQAAVDTFLEDYYCTSEAWSVKTSAERVLGSTNSWLYSQTHESQFRYEKDKGYVCTFSAMVLKASTAHIFHAGDARIYRVHGDKLEQLTEDHRLRLSAEKSFLTRALGVSAQLLIDYRTVDLEVGSTFVLSTDGLYEHVAESFVVDTVKRYADDLPTAAQRLIEKAYEAGSPDNLTVQIVRVDDLSTSSDSDVAHELGERPFAPALEPGTRFDGYTVVREIYASHRAHVYLALDDETGSRVVLKTPAVEVREDEAHLERFLREEWIARRIESTHVLRPAAQARKRNFVYWVSEYVEGQTLRQWMLDHETPSVEAVRGIVEQIARGLLAFHRRDMLHQDLRPENVMIDSAGTVKIIDFGSAWVAGIAEIDGGVEQPSILGTQQYTAPEYFLGERGSARSDLFSLGVITHEMLSGTLPYGTHVSNCRTREAQRRLTYRSVLHPARDIPSWVDDAIKKAVHPNPDKRYGELSEFTADLRVPNQEFLARARPPLIERDPAAFWKGVSAILAVIVFLLLRKVLSR